MPSQTRGCGNRRIVFLIGTSSFFGFPAKIKAPKMGMGSPKTAEKADDSCRVENAGVQMCHPGPFAVSMRSENFESFADQKWCVSEYTYLLSP